MNALLTLLNLSVPLSFFLVLLLGFAESHIFRKLVRLQHDSHRQSWEQDGRPIGPLFSPPQTKTWGGWLVRWSSRRASSRRRSAWLFATPAWIREDSRALRLLFWMRAMRVGKFAVPLLEVGVLLAFIGLVGE
jgi:hypothetical protein